MVIIIIIIIIIIMVIIIIIIIINELKEIELSSALKQTVPLDGTYQGLSFEWSLLGFV